MDEEGKRNGNKTCCFIIAYGTKPNPFPSVGSVILLS